jgi:hypothetical protein
MIKKKKKKSRKKILGSNNNEKIKVDNTGLYIWIAILAIGAVLYNFFENAYLIFGGIILFAIIRKGWVLGREKKRMKWF